MVIWIVSEVKGLNRVVLAFTRRPLLLRKRGDDE